MLTASLGSCDKLSYHIKHSCPLEVPYVWEIAKKLVSLEFA